MMEGFLQWFNDPSHASVSDVMRSEHCAGPVRAALAHLWFELVHPFDDGNGRVGRAIADMALCQSETKPPLFNLSTVLLQHRDDYYKALSSASRTLDATDWIVWFFHRTIEAQVQAKSVVHTIIEKTRFWDRVRRSGDGFLNDRQEKVLSALFMHEPVGFEGGMSARKYASLTRVSKATATRDLTDLTNKRCLLLVGSGRAARYYLNTRKYQALFNAPVPTP
jgi:Fic family protein